MRELWSAGIKSSLIETPLKDDVEDICSELNVPILITLNDSEPIYLRIKYMEKDRYVRKYFDKKQHIFKIYYNINKLDVFMMCNSKVIV